MDAYDPATVFSSIDHLGRYAYGNQPNIAQWNLARLAETLLPLLAKDEAKALAAAEESLGLVDKPNPDSDASEQDESDEAGGELIISGGDAPLLLEMSDEALDP